VIAFARGLFSLFNLSNVIQDRHPSIMGLPCHWVQREEFTATFCETRREVLPQAALRQRVWWNIRRGFNRLVGWRGVLRYRTYRTCCSVNSSTALPSALELVLLPEPTFTLQLALTLPLQFRYQFTLNVRTAYTWPGVIRIIKSMRMRWAGYVARMGRRGTCICYW
jgi:hypothetical protein